MDGSIGERPERPPGTRGAKNDSRKRCQSGRKRVSLRVPKGVEKKGKTRLGCTVGAKEKMGGEGTQKRSPNILKPRLWCERCVENQVMCVSQILQKRDAKGGVK